MSLVMKKQEAFFIADFQLYKMLPKNLLKESENSMKRKFTKTAALVLAGSLAMMGLVGCGNSGENNSATVETKTTEETALAGTLSLAGSTSMEKVCEALMEGFMEAYPEITVTTEYTGSGAGIESLNAGSVDIGNASRHVKEEEAANGAVENIIALDGIAVIVDPENSVVDISTQQLASIYKGEITNWAELGGEEAAIVVIGRESGSGTRDAFEELSKIKDECKYAQELDSTGAVLAKVASTPGAIGYVSLDVVDDSVIAEKLNGIDATEDNILNGTYALQRPFVMATKGDIEKQNELVKTWFDYIGSEEGKEIVQSVGLIIPN